MSYYLWEGHSERSFYELENISSFMPYEKNENTVRVNVNNNILSQKVFFSNSEKISGDSEEKSRRLSFFRTDAKNEVNSIFHMLRSLDEDNRLTRLCFDKDFFRGEICSQRYGREAAELFDRITPRMREIILYFMVYKERCGSNIILLSRAAAELFSDVLLHEDEFTGGLIVFTSSRGTDSEKCAWRLAVILFQELFTDVKIVWDTKPAVTGVSRLNAGASDCYTLY